jgi:hypothetical protein
MGRYSNFYNIHKAEDFERLFTLSNEEQYSISKVLPFVGGRSQEFSFRKFPQIFLWFLPIFLQEDPLPLEDRGTVTSTSL